MQRKLGLAVLQFISTIRYASPLSNTLALTDTFLSQDTADSEPVVLEVEFPSFPLCQLSTLSVAERTILGIEKNDSLIYIFDQSSSTWKLRGPSVPHTFLDSRGGTISKPVILLARSPDCPRTDIVRAAELSLKTRREPSRAGPAVMTIPSSDEDSSPSPAAAARPAPLRKSKRKICEVSVSDDDQPVLVSKKPKTQLTLTSSARIASTSNSSPIPDVSAMSAERLSGHAEWPLKYFKPMEEGLVRVSEPSDLTGNTPVQFKTHFGHTWKRTAYHKHLNTLRYAPHSLRTYFRSLGWSDEATWKNFRKVVLELYREDQDVLGRLTSKGTGKGRENTSHRKPKPTAHAIEAAQQWINARVSVSKDVPIVEDIQEETGEPTTRRSRHFSNDKCPACDEYLPKKPSDILKKKLEHFEMHATTHHGADLCVQHGAETAREKQPTHLQWPEKIDFAGLGQRLETSEHREVLEETWADPEASPFYEKLLDDAETLNMTRAKVGSISGDENYIGMG